MATVVVNVNGRGLGIGTHRRRQWVKLGGEREWEIGGYNRETGNWEIT